MKKISLKEMESDVVFGDICGQAQIWSATECTYTFIGNPRSDHGFMYICCDGVRIRYKSNTEETFSKGDLLYIPKYCEYFIEFLAPVEPFSDLLINFDIRNTAGEEFCFADKIVRLTGDVPKKIVTCMQEIADRSTNLKHPCIRVGALFYELLDKLANRITLPEMLSEETSVVFPAVFYLDNHVRDDVSVPELAKMCLLSESAFRKEFKAYTGMTPIQYRTHIKISKAQQLLRSTTEISVREIAESLGFLDNTYFYKMFIRITGQTPNQYRKQCAEKKNKT